MFFEKPFYAGIVCCYFNDVHIHQELLVFDPAQDRNVIDQACLAGLSRIRMIGVIQHNLGA